MARAWADQEEDKRRQAAQIETMREDVGALNRLSATDGAMTLTNSARGDQTRRTQGHGCKAYRVGQVLGHSSCYPWQALSEAVKQRDEAALCMCRLLFAIENSARLRKSLICIQPVCRLAGRGLDGVTHAPWSHYRQSQ
ncbi:hypothetical protein [Mameliella alba]|uniref:hypothetical protein n=2 Tax=Mameliella TaxID=1434019 RepID=UPI001054E91B|nr:hypothetical protein [Mameliella alba]